MATRKDLLKLVLNPRAGAFKVWEMLPVGSFKTRLDYDLFPRPNYAFCVYHAARNAAQLGLERVSVIEFGVAGGNGLVELERLADLVEDEFDVTIEVYGFDSGTGLPQPEDHRDLPYIWQQGFFEMDLDALRARLTRATLVIGDVRETVDGFFDEHDPAPVGAIFHDLDYHSSTRDALRLTRSGDKYLLPRIYCYFDDIFSSELGGLMCEAVGQLRAIREYNEVDEDHHLGPMVGLRHTRARPAPWNEKIYVHHAFRHPDYGTYIHPDRVRQLPLRPGGTR